jgi:cob(I)alamin adenosyltransferase
MAKIYTKTGDTGETGLIGGKRVPKNNIRVEAYGTVDEANALLGVILARFEYFTHADELADVQSMLFEIGAVLADPQARNQHPNETDVKHLEELIDELTEDLPPLTNFILPGGSELSAYLHLARTFVRRAERRVVTVMQFDQVPVTVMQYLNRLSDYLFTLARKINQERGIKDILWQKR